jgi:hypothetical protein
MMKLRNQIGHILPVESYRDHSTDAIQLAAFSACVAIVLGCVAYASYALWVA